jgi:hypothetical protein
LINNDFNAVGQFLSGTIGLGVGDIASTVYQWLGGTSDQLSYAFGPLLIRMAPTWDMLRELPVW